MLLFTYVNNKTIAEFSHQQPQRVLNGHYDCKQCRQRKRWRRKLRAMSGDTINNLIEKERSQQRNTTPS